MEMVQFHPTGLLAGPRHPHDRHRAGGGLRGAGGYLLNGAMHRFMGDYDPHLERATRDVVSRAIYAEMRAGRTTPHGGVYIKMSHLGPESVKKQFKGMVERCPDCGFDLVGGLVEVVPTAHYFMGGVVCRTDTSTELPGLFVAGEDASGMHGANRLGGNGVANSTVFGGIAGDTMPRWIKANPRPSRARRARDRGANGAGAGTVRAPAGRPQPAARSAHGYHVGRCRRHPRRAGLDRGLSAIDDIEAELAATGVADADRAFNLTWHDWLNLRSLVETSRVIALAARAAGTAAARISARTSRSPASLPPRPSRSRGKRPTGSRSAMSRSGSPSSVPARRCSKIKPPQSKREANDDPDLSAAAHRPELMAKAAIEIPDDYLAGLRECADTEKGDLSAFVIQAMLENYEAAKEDRRAMCGDTGVPRWYVKIGNEARIEGGPVALEAALRRATANATHEVPLRPNRVHPLWRTDHNNNVGINAPEIEYAFHPDAGMDRPDHRAQGRSVRLRLSHAVPRRRHRRHQALLSRHADRLRQARARLPAGDRRGRARRLQGHLHGARQAGLLLAHGRKPQSRSRRSRLSRTS